MAERKNPMDRYLPTLGKGVVEWIGVRPHRREPLISVDRVSAAAEYGLEGDHRMLKTPGSGRQVTLISSEFLHQIRQHLGLEDCLLYTSPSPRDLSTSRMPSSA